MEAQNQAVNNVSQSSKFTWRIENFSQLKKTKYYSDTFTIGSHEWKLLVFPKRRSKDCLDDYLSIYLDAVDTVDSTYAKFCLVLVDQIDSNNTLRKDFKHKFTAKEKDWGTVEFIQLKDLKKPGKGYIVNDVCIVEVEFTSNSTQDSTEELESSVAEEETSKEELLAEKMTDHPTKPSTQSSNNIRIGEYPNAGQLFEEGKHNQQDVLDDEKFEEVGGFKILKTQASLYKKIWLKYGHIATSKILRNDSYSVQVTLVSGIMTTLVEMSVDKISSEVIELFEFKLKMAEDFRFNVKWLREWFENVKKDFYAEQKLKTALVTQDQYLVAAMKQLSETKEEFTKKLTEVKDEFTKKLSGIETTISTLLSETQMKKQVSRGLLFDGLF